MAQRGVAIEIETTGKILLQACVAARAVVRVERLRGHWALDGAHTLLHQALGQLERGAIGVLRAEITLLDALFDEAVAALRREAVAGTAIGVVPVAIVALLAGVDDAVAARVQGTDRAAAVAIDHVAVVARLDAIEDKAVAALREGAVDASVGRDRVAVVARLGAVDHVITAPRNAHWSRLVAPGAVDGEARTRSAPYDENQEPESAPHDASIRVVLTSRGSCVA